MIVIKLINITNDPSLIKFPHQWERAGSWSRVMISDKNHRDHLVNKDNLFTINHLGVENTEDYVEACALDQGQSRLEYKIRNNVTYDTYAYEDPINDNKTHKVISYYHINYSSILWGLVDDMSVAVVYCHHVMNPFEKEQLNYQPSIGIEIQSEARFGSDDFESNPSRVADFYDWLSSKIDPAYISNRGSVCNRQSDD